MQHDDDRRHPRVRIAAVASLETKGQLNANDQALGSVRDVSRSGIGLQTGQPPLRGQAVILRIAVDDEVHELRAHATRVTKVGNSNFYDVGLDWGPCTVEQLAFLEKALAAIEQQPQV
jgi:hypothetical protein